MGSGNGGWNVACACELSDFPSRVATSGNELASWPCPLFGMRSRRDARKCVPETNNNNTSSAGAPTQLCVRLPGSCLAGTTRLT